MLNILIRISESLFLILMYLFMEKYTSNIMKCINQCDASKHIIFVIKFSNTN